MSQQNARVSLDTITGKLHVLTQRRMSFEISGFFIRCIIGTPADFLVSLDNGPAVPFGPGRTLAPKAEDGTPIRFSRVTFSFDPDFDIGTLFGVNELTIECVYGDIDYSDNRVQVMPGQVIRVAAASAMNAYDVTLAGGPLVSNILVGGVSAYGTKKITVRNTHATADVRISTVQAEVTTPNSGKILGPGEEEDFEVNAALYASGAAGVVLNVCRYYYTS